MTAEEILPVLIDASESIVTTLANTEIFPNISMLTALLSLFVLSIILEVVTRFLSGGMVMPGDYETQTSNMKFQDDFRQYR